MQFGGRRLLDRRIEIVKLDILSHSERELSVTAFSIPRGNNSSRTSRNCAYRTKPFRRRGRMCPRRTRRVANIRKQLPRG